ncbi:ABC transporter ATP-binding protein [Streptomyces sp. BK561]|uniref:ABC transporter ATP-binding protein n=1 Tax=Streptomyces sp. NBC_00582 TaxID=2975783 RepID=UPI001415310E
MSALDDVSLSLEAGELVGLLGLNGAGKTTLLKIASTLLLPSSGTVRVCGHDVVTRPREAQRLLSLVLGGDRGLYARLSARDNLRFFASLAGLRGTVLKRAAEEAIGFVGLDAAADRLVETYSKGMRQRLHLAIGMVTRPQLLLLDEPTVGLDWPEAVKIRAAVARMRDEGTAVLLTSHYLQDIEQLAERVVVLHHGHVLHDMPLAHLLARARTAAVVDLTGHGRLPAVDAFPSSDEAWVERAEEHGDGWTIRINLRSWSPDALRALVGLWPDRQIATVQVTPSGLHEVFAELAAAERKQPVS